MKEMRDTKAIRGLERDAVQTDDAADLLSAALKTIRVLGSITNRRPEAEGLSIAILDTFGKR